VALVTVASLGVAGCGGAFGSVIASGATEGGSDGSSSTGGSETGTGTTGASACPCGPEEACIDDGCYDVGRSAIEAGCHPLSQGVCLYPWPSNFTTVSDAASATGRLLHYDPALLPMTNGGAAFAAAEITDAMQGFSPNSQIRFVSAKGVMSEGLAGIDDIAGSLAEGATTVLVQAESGERWPHFAEVDAVAPSPDRQAVFIRPMRRLAFGSRYVVAVRGLRDADGAPLEPPPLFRALRDGLSTDVPELEALRPAYEEIFGILAEGGVPRGELQLAWDFTTAPIDQAYRDAAAIVPQLSAVAAKGDLGYTITEVEEPGGAVGRVIRGTFKAPNCMTGAAEPGSLLRRDADGLPVCEGTVDAPFVVAIPQSVIDAGVPARASLYGHGLLGTGEEAVSVASKVDGVIMAGTDWWGMAEEDIPNIGAVLQNNFANGRSMPERLLQSVVNFSTLAYLLRGDLAMDQALFAEKTPLIDAAAPVAYVGGSQGGIMGGTTMAIAPNLERGVLVVGGANYSLMVWRSTAFSAINQIWAAHMPDPLEREFLFSIYQSAFDASDPAIYAEAIRSAPLPGNGPRQLLLVESIGDAQVPNVATEMMARTYGMRMLGPAVTPVFGVPTVDQPIDDVALLQVDTKMGPLPPTTNEPASDDNGAHGASADGPGVQETIKAFLLEGVFASKCDGVCDPD